MILFIDTETSGLPKNDKWPRLLQIAWKLEDDVNVTSYYIKPDFSEDFEGTEIHGITKDFAIQNGVNIKYVLNRLNDALLCTDIVCAHNADFDLMVLLAEFERYQISTELTDKLVYDTMISSVNYCKIPAKMGRGYKWPSLAECYEKCTGTSFQSSRSPTSGKLHNAKSDVMACIECFNILYIKGFMRLHVFNI